jgi:DNA-binding MarR family transcriptional regulator
LKESIALALPERQESEEEALRFLLDHIDSVPELEALLLLWQHRPAYWKISDLVRRLYIDQEQTREILQGLSRKELIVEDELHSGSYRYESKSEQQDQLIACAEELYRREIVRISTLIHSKPPRAIRDFADAFRFKKEKP